VKFGYCWTGSDCMLLFVSHLFAHCTHLPFPLFFSILILTTVVTHTIPLTLTALPRPPHASVTPLLPAHHKKLPNHYRITNDATTLHPLQEVSGSLIQWWLALSLHDGILSCTVHSHPSPVFQQHLRRPRLRYPLLVAPQVKCRCA
jgi:hypothetical protein